MAAKKATGSPQLMQQQLTDLSRARSNGGQASPFIKEPLGSTSSKGWHKQCGQTGMVCKPGHGTGICAAVHIQGHAGRVLHGRNGICPSQNHGVPKLCTTMTACSPDRAPVGTHCSPRISAAGCALLSCQY